MNLRSISLHIEVKLNHLYKCDTELSQLCIKASHSLVSKISIFWSFWRAKSVILLLTCTCQKLDYLYVDCCWNNIFVLLYKFINVLLSEIAVSNFEKKLKLNPQPEEDLQLEHEKTSVETTSSIQPLAVEKPSTTQGRSLDPVSLVHYNGDSFYLAVVSKCGTKVWYSKAAIARIDKNTRTVVAATIRKKQLALECNGWQECDHDHVVGQIPSHMATSDVSEKSIMITKNSEELLDFVVEKICQWLD